MISIGRILRRSWYILWHYRVLWVLGFLLALTIGWNSGNNGGNPQVRQNIPINNLPYVLPDNAPQWMHQLSQWFTQNVQPLVTHPQQYVGTIVMIVVLFLLVVLILGALAAVVRYPAETAVMRMVDEYEQSGNKLSFRQGWRLGWTRRAFRLWLIDLILAIPVLVFVALIALAGLIVYFSVSSTFQVTNTTGVVAAIGLGFLSIFFLLVTAVFLTLLRNFFARAVALDGVGVNAALRSGWAMFRRNWKSAGLMWLVTVGIWIAVGILGLVVFFLLIPTYLVMLIPAALVAALPALIAFGITRIFAGGPLTWIIALLAALPFFFVILFAPLLLVVGWYRIYESNIWTLTYREIKALESLTPPSAPAEGTPNAAQ
jgi:hypothetical protein